MKKKRSVVQSIRSKRVATQERSWNNGGDIEVTLYARALRRAVKTLIVNLDLKPNPVSGWDAAPVFSESGKIRRKHVSCSTTLR